MPYIKQERRNVELDSLAWDAGELNYEITTLLISYMDKHGLRYQTCNDIVGALENAKHEFQRRIQDRYEDLKIQENGDVYETQAEE